MGNSATCSCSLAPTQPVRKILPLDGAVEGPSVESMETWDFDIFELDQQRLAIAVLVLLQACAWKCSGSDSEVLPNFICCVRDGYQPNPYHNFCHGVDVLQTLFRMGSLMAWDRLFPPAMRFALLVAALAHDVGHPGYSNVFLIDVRDEMACRYNDISPLENMHCSRLLEIVQEERCNVFKSLSPQEFRSIRQLMVDVVLHTDPAHHDGIVAGLTKLYRASAEVFDAANTSGQGLTPAQVELLSQEGSKKLVGRVLLVGADLSNQGKPWRFAHRWAELMQQELFAQGDRERDMGIPMSEVNDRGAVGLSELQIGQLNLMVVPFVAAASRVFPAWHQLAATLAANVKQWGVELSQEKAEEDKGQTDVRVDCMCSLLENPRTSIALASSVAGHSQDSLNLEQMEPCSEPSCPEAPAPQPLVREIRRWREIQNAPGVQRELVLLYVQSDEDASRRTGQPILFRFTLKDAPENGLQPGLQYSSPPMVPATSACSTAGNPQSPVKGPPSPRPSTQSGTLEGMSNFSSPIQAQASMDSKCLPIDTTKFDTLLSSVLEDLPEIISTARGPPGQTTPPPGRKDSTLSVVTSGTWQTFMNLKGSK